MITIEVSSEAEAANDVILLHFSHLWAIFDILACEIFTKRVVSYVKEIEIWTATIAICVLIGVTIQSLANELQRDLIQAVVGAL